MIVWDHGAIKPCTLVSACQILLPIHTQMYILSGSYDLSTPSTFAAAQPNSAPMVTRSSEIYSFPILADTSCFIWVRSVYGLLWFFQSCVTSWPIFCRILKIFAQDDMACFLLTHFYRASIIFWDYFTFSIQLKGDDSAGKLDWFSFEGWWIAFCRPHPTISSSSWCVS